MKIFATSLFCLVASSAALSADARPQAALNPAKQRAVSRKPAAIDTKETSAEHSHHHHVAIFSGLTSHSGHSDFTLGLDYGYKISDRMAIAGIADFAFTAQVTSVLAAGVVVNPIPGVRAVVAPGVEFYKGYANGLLRLGVGYDFHVDALSIGPTYNADIVGGGRGTSHVYGVSLGYGF